MRIIVKFDKPVESERVDHSRPVDPHQVINKIRTIKYVRNLTGCSLKTAKECTESTFTIDTDISMYSIDTDNAKQLINYIRFCGGVVVYGTNPWKNYINEIKEMLFTAKLTNNDVVMYRLQQIIDEHEMNQQYQGL
jgi:hypothetical protein